MKTAAIYTRVASPEEHIEDQLLDLRRLAAQRGYEVAEYTDIVSCTKARRPGLDALRRDARKRKFDVVLVAALDRVARSAKHFFQLVVELSDLGIEFVSQQDNIGTTGELGGQFLMLARSILKLHADLNKELIRAGMRRRKLDGFRLGRKPLNVDRDALVRDRLNGMSLTNCSKHYHLSRASVVRFVREAQRRNMTRVSGVPVEKDKLAVLECVA